MADSETPISASAFSTENSEQFIPVERTIESQDIPEFKLELIYSITDTVEWIRSNSYTKVALQFSDELLVHSVPISRLIEKGSGIKPYILADTSYGSCCVDEVAAQHVDADCLVHYGEACLSQPPDRLPVKYVFPKSDIDVQDLVSQLQTALAQDKDVTDVVLLYELAYHHINGRRIINELDEPVKSIEFNDGAAVLFIGDPETNPVLTLWVMAYPQAQKILVYNPKTKLLTSSEIKVMRMLKKRLFLMEKLKDSQILNQHVRPLPDTIFIELLLFCKDNQSFHPSGFEPVEIIGILAGTLGVRGHVDSLNRVKQVCKAAGKKVYVFSVGKINPPKLANFATEIDMFVLISCPFGVLLEYGDYFRPILSIFEVEMALNPDANPWMADSGWFSEFNKIQIAEKNSQNAGNVSEPDFSLITGKMRIPKSQGNGDSQQLVEYDPGQYFRGRTWRGLDPEIGENLPVEEAGEGRKGIAAGYETELPPINNNENP